MMIDAGKVLAALAIFNDRENGNPHFLNGIETAREIIQNEVEAQRKRNSRKTLPCICGCKRKEHWISPDKEKREGLKCMKCGFEMWGKNSKDAIRRWNTAVEAMRGSAMPKEENQ